MKIYHQWMFSLTLLGTLAYDAQAQITAQKIGNNPTVKHPSALLELESTNKGVLFTRVPLTSTADIATISTPTNGLTIFNTATVSLGPNSVSPGYYFWSTPNAKWMRLVDEISNNNWLLTGNANTSSTANYLGTSNNQDLVIKTDGIERMRVNVAGNIGVGTSPTARLDINGTTMINDKVFPRFATNGRSAVFLVTDNVRPYTGLGLRLYDSNSNSHVLFNALGSGEIQSYGIGGAATNVPEIAGQETSLYLNPRGGNVGIGTTAATHRLDIASGNVRVRGITSSVGNIATDRVMVADANGILKTIASANVISKTASYSLSSNDETVLVSTDTTPFITITLPAASTVNGKKYFVKKITGIGSVLVNSAGGTIDGVPSGTGISFSTSSTCVGFQSNGTNWFIISRYRP